MMPVYMCITIRAVLTYGISKEDSSVETQKFNNRVLPLLQKREGLR
jgi:hypothetical protein